MPLIWTEDNASRSATIYRLGKKATSTLTKSWKVTGTTDDTTLHNEINSQLSQYQFWTYPGTSNLRLMVESYSVEYLGDDAWQVTATYEKEGADAVEGGDDQNQQGTPLKRTRSFDTSGATLHITQALGEDRFGGVAPPNMNKAIGVDGDSVQGVDIVVPQFTWTETYDVPAAFVTLPYARSLASLTGAVNNADFRTFKAGEVLFLGATGSHEWDTDKGDGPWSLAFKFQASPNAGANETLEAITIGDITNIQKKGHEYLWVRYEDAVASDTLIKRPKYVYVNKVYREADFNGLGIGS